jgi:NAD-dependent SIR2 family protein deacetylase
MRAKQAGAKLAIINKGSTPLDSVADYVIDAAAGSILPKLINLKRD